MIVKVTFLVRICCCWKYKIQDNVAKTISSVFNQKVEIKITSLKQECLISLTLFLSDLPVFSALEMFPLLYTPGLAGPCDTYLQVTISQLIMKNKFWDGLGQDIEV